MSREGFPTMEEWMEIHGLGDDTKDPSKSKSTYEKDLDTARRTLEKVKQLKFGEAK